MQYLLYTLIILPFVLGVYAFYIKQKDFGCYLIGYAILSIIQEIFKAQLIGQPKPYVDRYYVYFIVQAVAYLSVPTWLLFNIGKSYNSTIIQQISLLIIFSIIIGLLIGYPTIRGQELITIYYWYHVKIFIVCLAYFIFEYIKYKINSNQFLLLISLLQGIVQITIIIAKPGTYYHWISLGMYYIMILIQLFLLKYYD